MIGTNDLMLGFEVFAWVEWDVGADGEPEWELPKTRTKGAFRIASPNKK